MQIELGTNAWNIFEFNLIIIKSTRVWHVVTFLGEGFFLSS